jgi:NADH:ubiquinone oxidoreductase subunit E
MVTITLCVGSSCYIKGAHAVARSFDEAIREYKLSMSVELKGSFCLGRCREGVAVTVNGKALPRINPDKAREFFLVHILPEVSKYGTN